MGLIPVFYFAIRCMTEVVHGGLLSRLCQNFPIQPPASAVDYIGCCMLLGIMLNVSFAYTNYVTTARKTFFRGLHNGLRDIVFVNACVPCIVWWCRLHEPGRLLPTKHMPHGMKPSMAEVAHLSGVPVSDVMPSLPTSLVSSILEVHMEPYAAGLVLCFGLMVGLNILHLARGRFDGSISGADVSQVRHEVWYNDCA